MTKTLADWLVARYPTAKRTTLRRMVADGRVRVNGRPANRYNQPVGETDAVAVDERPGGGADGGEGGGGAGRSAASRRGGPAAARLPFAIVFEDADLLVVDKPPGLLTSTTPREPRPTLLASVRAYLSTGDRPARVGLIHRLDRDASGLLVFSKSDVAYQSLKTQFFKHDVERVYLAVTQGVPRPPAGRIESTLSERIDGTVHSIKQVGRGERAVTDYEVVRAAGKRALVRVTLQTGRKHQIRVHLRERGTPIVGDRVYGHQDPGALAEPRLMLAAVRLAVAHPRTGERVTFESPTPEAFERALGTNPGLPNSQGAAQA